MIFRQAGKREAIRKLLVRHALYNALVQPHRSRNIRNDIAQSNVGRIPLVETTVAILVRPVRAFNAGNGIDALRFRGDVDHIANKNRLRAIAT